METRNCSDCNHFCSTFKRRKSSEEVICTKGHSPRHSKNYGYRRKCSDYDENEELTSRRKAEEEEAAKLLVIRADPKNSICYVDIVNQLWPEFDLSTDISGIFDGKDALNLLHSNISSSRLKFEEQLKLAEDRRQKLIKLAEEQLNKLKQEVLEQKMIELELRRRTMEVEDELIRRDEIELARRERAAQEAQRLAEE